MPQQLSDSQSGIVVAWIFAVVTIIGLVVLMVLSASAVRALCFRFKGFKRRGTGKAYDLELHARLVENEHFNDVAGEEINGVSVSQIQNEIYRGKLELDIQQQVNGFQCLSEATALVPRLESLAHRYHTLQRIAAILVSVLLPINLMVFQYTNQAFECISEEYGDFDKCTANPPSSAALDVTVRVWELIGLFLPALLLYVFYLVQDDNMDVDMKADGDTDYVNGDTGGSSTSSPRASTATLYHSQEQSYVLRILSLAHRNDKTTLARSMDKWASISLSLLGVILALAVISMVVEIAESVRNISSMSQFAEVVVFIIVVSMQSFYVSATTVTILLHLRTFRKVLLLDIRRAFRKVSESTVFKWMKKDRGHGDNPLKEYAESFLSNVLDPFGRAVQWLLWLAVFAMAINLLNVLVLTLIPYRQVYDFGEYISGFFVTIAIVIGFAYMAYKNLQEALNSAFVLQEIELLKGTKAIEPLLLFGEALGFKHGQKVREAVKYFDANEAELKEAFKEAKGIRSARDALRFAGTQIEDTIAKNPVAFESAKGKVAGLGAKALSGKMQQEILKLLQDEKSLTTKLLALPGMSNEETAAQLAHLASRIGRANIDGSKTVGQLRDIQHKIQTLKEVRAAPPVERTAQALQLCSELVSTWASFQQIADSTVVYEFTNVVLPKLQEKTINMDEVMRFLSERIQMPEVLLEPIKLALADLDVDLGLD